MRKPQSTTFKQLSLGLTIDGATSAAAKLCLFIHGQHHFTYAELARYIELMEALCDSAVEAFEQRVHPDLRPSGNATHSPSSPELGEP